MRYKEIISESNTTDKLASYLASRGFAEVGEPTGAMGEWGGSPQYYLNHTYEATLAPDTANKFFKAFSSKTKRDNLDKMIKIKSDYVRDKNKSLSVKVVINFKWPTATPTPTDRPKIKFPYHDDSEFAVGDKVEIGARANSATKMGIIGVDHGDKGTIVRDNGDGTFVIRPSSSNPSNPYNDLTVPGDTLSLIDTYWHGAAPDKNGQYKPTNGKADVNDYEELALHPSERGTVTLTGKHKKTGERHKLDNAYIDQVHNRFRQKGENHQFSGQGVVPDKAWWDSLSPAEKQRYTAK